MGKLSNLRDYLNDNWKIKALGNDKYISRWSSSIHELTESAINSFADYEVPELKTDELEEVAKTETGIAVIKWDFTNDLYSCSVEGVKDETLKDYLLERMNQWVDMAKYEVEE